MNELQKKIITYALECVETPFKHQGRRIGLSLDCVGLIIHIAKKLGLQVNDVVGYGRNPNVDLLVSSLESHEYLHKVNIFEPGDIFLMKFTRNPQHFAIFTGSDIIHSYEKIGKVVYHSFVEPWPERVVQAYRIIL